MLRRRIAMLRKDVLRCLKVVIVLIAIISLSILTANIPSIFKAISITMLVTTGMNLAIVYHVFKEKLL